MTNFPVDLHTHSTASDGRLAPTELVAKAAASGLRVLALTDHDSAAGVDEALTAGLAYNLTVVPGIEFSTRHEYEKGFIGIHLLGYFFDHHHPAVEEAVEKVQAGRLEQKIRQIEIMQSFGFDIPVEAVLARVSGVPGRPHIAAVLMDRNPGRFLSIQHIFDEYLGYRKKAHVGRSFALKVGEAAQLIHEAGGLSVLAHPAIYDSEVSLEKMVEYAAADGVQGLEINYPYREVKNQQRVPLLAQLAERFNMVQTGGTDFHGRAEDVGQLGSVGLSLAEFERLEAQSRN
jgi:predicted metal-dependent phosphoesterase TrpH